MGWFDWVPTVEEVFEFAECRLGGHSWVRADYRIVCKTCGKERK